MPSSLHLPELHWDSHASGMVLRPSGPWTLAHYHRLQLLIQDAAKGKAVGQTPHTLDAHQLDLGSITELDTAGADQLALLLGPALYRCLESSGCPLSAAQIALLRTVATARATLDPTPRTQTTPAWRELLERVGDSTCNVAKQTRALLEFTGITLEALARTVLKPHRWRLTSLAAHVEESALNAVPIVALLTFMVGAVIAFLGATILEGFGAGIYAVHLVTFSFLREFAVLLTAILVAGRTASAYTAQIGSMKVNEEIDAIRMLGLNPIELLVLPRVLALVIAVPCLTLVGMVFGILGGALVCVFALDITPSMFMSIFQERIPMRHFIIGLAKAPVFAFAIAIIGCLEGLRVSGSAQSVGQHTTSAVVQSIFVVILLDAVAALFFMEMGW